MAEQWLSSGWTFQTRKLSGAQDYQQLQASLGTAGEDWQLMGGVSPRGSFWLATSEQNFRPDADWIMMYFAPNDEARSAAARPVEQDFRAAADADASNETRP